MKSSKLKSLVAMATMTGIVSMSSTGYHSNDVKNNTNNNVKETTMLASTSSTTTGISPNDLQVDITNVSVTKALANIPSSTDKYVPENNVPQTGDIATTGTIVTYNISVSLRSKSGKLYKVPDLYLTANPIAKYVTNGKEETAQEKQAADAILKAINVKLGKLKNLNSTSTFTITASFNIGQSDWNVNLIPNINIHIDVNGKKQVIPVNAPDIKLTKHYTNYITPTVTVSPDSSNKHVQYLNVKFSNWSNSQNDGVYNVRNSTPKNLTFKINNPDPKNLTITPLDIPGLVVNPDGTYTIPTSMIGSANEIKMFKITSNTNNRFMQTITVTPVNETFESPSGVDASVATSNYYQPGSATISQGELNNDKNAINMQQSSVTGSSYQITGFENNNKVTYSSTIDAGLKGKYKVYTGSLVSNGEVVLENLGQSYINNSQTYYSLNQNAVDILKGGTPQEKEKILWDMVHGQMNGIGEMYTASQMSALNNAQKPLPKINFVMSEGDYNGSKLNISSSYTTAPTAGINNRVISRTYTIGVLQGNYTPEQLKDMQEQVNDGKASQDGVVTTDGKFNGFMMSPPNSYTDAKVQADNISQITDERYTGYSHGLSSGTVQAGDSTYVTVDNFGNQNTNSINQVNASWLNKPHQFSATVVGGGNGTEADFTNHSQMVINMGAPFKLIGDVQLSGLNLPEGSYKIDGDKLIVDFPASMQQSISSQPYVSYEAQYTNPDNIIKPLDVSAKMVGPDGHQGLQYNYNNIPNHSVVDGGVPTQTEYQTKIVIARTTTNDCQHSATSVDSNDEVTLTDMVQNGNGETKQYMIVGQIPTDGSNNLPAEDGAVSQGGLTTKLETLDTNGAPTWVLPKSALNTENQELLDSPDANNLKGKMAYVENPANGWIKYVPGKTDLSDIVGYVTTPTIQGGQDFEMKYKVKLGGIQPGTYQIINSAFKYYDMTNNIGSTSNIVTLTPPSENLNYTWISGVTTPTGELTKAELDNTVDGHSLQELFGHGPDNDGNLDLTPTELQNKVNLATNAEEMKKLGYKLDKIEVNGQVVTPEWFKTVGILQNTGITHVKFVISKLPAQPKYTDIVKVVNDSDNNKVVSEVSKTGVSGDETGLKTPEIPKGYHVVSVTNNGKTVEPGVPSKFTNEDQNIVYHIAKNPSTTVSEVYPDGKPVVASKTTVNIAGDKVDTAIPEIPSGYQITKITVNGKEVPQSEVPTVQSKDNQTIVYTIGKMPTDTVKVVDNNGNELVPAVSKTGKTGTETGLNTPEIPKGYHVVDITNGNGDKVTGVPKTFGSSDNTTIYHVAKDITDKVYVDVKTESGTVLTPSHEVASGAPGSKVNVEMPEIPKDYHIVKVIVDNNVITPDKEGKYELPKTLSDNQNQEVDNHVEVIVAKNPTTTVEEVDQNGKPVVAAKTTTNVTGAKVNTGLPELPNGYKVIKVTVDGKVVPESEVPTVQSKDNQTIVYTIGKISTDTVKVVDENNQPIVPEVSKTGVSGDETGLKTPEIPKGYHIVSVTNNGKTVEPGVPSKFTNEDQNIIYHIAKNPSTTVSEVYPDGKPVVASKTTVNTAGDKVDTAIPEIPSGYQITKITVNGKEVPQSEVPTVQSKDNQTIVYTIGKMPTDTVKVVDNNGNELVPAVSKTGKTGTETGLNTPEIPKGYHVVDITNGNGDKVTGVPKTFGSSDNTTIYHVAKDITDKVYVDVKTESGTVLTPSHEVASGAPGSKVNVEMPEIPKDYHIVKVIVDNNVITPDKNGKYELPNTLSDNQNKEVDNHVEVIVAKNPTTTVEEVDQNGKPVVATKTTVNVEGAKVDTGLPELPNGYKVIKVTVDGKVVPESEVPTVQSKNDQTIVYTIGKISTDTVKVVDENNQPMVPEVSKTGVSGDETGLKTPEIPKGYHIVSVTNNGKTVEPGVPSKFTNEDQNIVYHIAKNPNTTVSEVYPDGKTVVPSKTTVNVAGAKVDTAIPEIPNGYQITKITVNGKEVSQNEVPTVQSKDNQTIIYTIGKMPTDTVKVVDNNGKEIVPAVSKTGKTGTATGLNTPEIPKGYHVVDITNGNGDKVTGVPKTFGDNDNTTIYHVEKNTPEDHNGDKTKPADHNDGKTTPEDHNGDKTKPADHNDGKTTPADHNDGKTTPEDHNGDKTKPVDHNDGKTTSENHNTDKTTSVDHDNDKTTPVNHNNSDINKVDNSSNTSTTINTLPHTGIGQSQDNGAKEAGALAGLMGVIAALGIFRRKKK